MQAIYENRTVETNPISMVIFDKARLKADTLAYYRVSKMCLHNSDCGVYVSMNGEYFHDSIYCQTFCLTFYVFKNKNFTIYWNNIHEKHLQCDKLYSSL